MNDESRRRFLRRTAGLVGSGTLAAVAGCTDSPGDGTAGSPTGAATPTPTDAGTESPTGTPTTTGPVTPATDPLDGAWESYRHDAANTAASDDSGPTERPSELWRLPTATDAVPATAPVAVDDSFVVVTESGRPYALAAADGTIRWTADRTVGTHVDPVASDGTVCVADGEEMVALAADTGAVAWTASFDGGVVGLAAHGERVFAATDGAVVALDVAGGDRQWRHSVEGTAATGPGTDGDAVAVGLGSGEVLAVDGESGELAWRESLVEAFAAAPTVADGTVYVPAPDRLDARDAASGDRQWAAEPDMPVSARPVVADGTVYLATFTDDAEFDREGTRTPPPTDVNRFELAVLALDPGDGSERWRAGGSGQWNFTSGPPSTGLAAGEDRVFVTVSDGLLAFDAASGDGAWSVQVRGLAPAVADGVVSTGAIGVAAADGTVEWRFEVGNAVDSAPAVVGNTVYVGSEDFHCYAAAANSGQVEWRSRTNGEVRSSPAVDDSTVYVGSADGHLYAFDRGTGDRQWRFDTGGPVESSPTVVDGTVYVGSESARLSAVDAADGTERWHATFEDYFFSSTPAVADGTVYACAGDVLRALDAADGTELWSVTFGPDSRLPQSVPAVSGGRVFLHDGATLHAYDATDGAEKWSRAVGGATVMAPAVRDGTVYATGDESVYAFDAGDGTRQWQSDVGYALWVVAGAEAVFARAGDDGIVALDPADGERLWRHTGIDTRRGPGLAGEYLFVGGFDGSVRALGPDPD